MRKTPSFQKQPTTACADGTMPITQLRGRPVAKDGAGRPWKVTQSQTLSTSSRISKLEISKIKNPFTKGSLALLKFDRYTMYSTAQLAPIAAAAPYSLQTHPTVGRPGHRGREPSSSCTRMLPLKPAETTSCCTKQRLLSQ